MSKGSSTEKGKVIEKFIESMIKRGYPKEDIAEFLIKRGWGKGQVAGYLSPDIPFKDNGIRNGRDGKAKAGIAEVKEDITKVDDYIKRLKEPRINGHAGLNNFPGSSNGVPGSKNFHDTGSIQNTGNHIRKEPPLLEYSPLKRSNTTADGNNAAANRNIVHQSAIALCNFIKESIREGYSEKQIKRALRKKGWPRKMIRHHVSFLFEHYAKYPYKISGMKIPEPPYRDGHDRKTEDKKREDEEKKYPEGRTSDKIVPHTAPRQFPQPQPTPKIYTPGQPLHDKKAANGQKNVPNGSLAEAVERIPAEKMQPVSERKPVEGIKEEAKRPEIKKPVFSAQPSREMPIIASYETPIDKLFQYIKTKRIVPLEEAAQVFSIRKELVEEWAKILEHHQLIVIDYPTFGSVRLTIAGAGNADNKSAGG